MSLMLRRASTVACSPLRFFASATTTVDIQEIEQFRKLSSEWWDEFGPTKGLHSMNRLRVPFIRDGLINEGAIKNEYLQTPTPLKGLSILDVGCGGGILSESLARLGASVTGIDANPTIVDIAKKHAEKSNISINYLFTSIEEHSQNYQEKYDVIAASEILEHVTEKQAFLKACANCLKPSGSMFVTTMNKTCLASFLGIYVSENVLNLVPKGTHQLEKFIEPHKLQRLFEDNTMRTKLVHGMFYNVFTNNWHWCSDLSINYALHAVKFKELS